MAVDDAAAHRAPQVALVIEPTPFTHISGYANRFKEMLKFMKKADVQVEVRRRFWQRARVPPPPRAPSSSSSAPGHDPDSDIPASCV